MRCGGPGYPTGPATPAVQKRRSGWTLTPRRRQESPTGRPASRRLLITVPVELAGLRRDHAYRNQWTANPIAACPPPLRLRADQPRVLTAMASVKITTARLRTRLGAHHDHGSITERYSCVIGQLW